MMSSEKCKSMRYTSHPLESESEYYYYLITSIVKALEKSYPLNITVECKMV